MKKGLNRADIAKYHNMLEEEMPLKDISRVLHTTPDVLKRLTPDKFKKAEKAKKDREKEIMAQTQENRTKADILTQTAAQVLNTPAPSK